MIGYILLFLLTVVAWVVLLYGINHKIDWAVCVGMISAIILTAAFIALSAILINKSSEAYATQKEREYYSDLVQELPENASFETISRIISSAKYINRKIELNKKYYDNPMIGFYYSREIGELESIEIPKFSFSKKELESE